MTLNGKTPDVETMFLNSTSKMAISSIIDNQNVVRFLDADTLVKVSIDGTEYTGTVNNYNTIKQVDTSIIITVPVNSTVTLVEENYQGVMVYTEEGNLNILYNAKDVQVHTSVTNIDGFDNISDTDIYMISGLTIGLAASRGVIDGLAFNISQAQSINIQAGGSLPRIDLVVLRKDQSAGTTTLLVKEGISSLSPVAPSLVQAPGGVYEIPIFQVLVNAAQITINRGEIVDLRTHTTKQSSVYKPMLTAGVYQYAGDLNYLPDWILYADGSEVSRTKYSRLYERIKSWCGQGDGSTTFNLPDWRDKVFTGVGQDPKMSRHNGFTKAGQTADSGLPNLSGNMVYLSNGDTGGTNGVFRGSPIYSSAYSGGGSGFSVGVTFNSSHQIKDAPTVRNNSAAVYNCIIA